MKFIVTSTALLKQLQLLSGVLSSNNTLPILDNFLFEIRNKELILSASDLETSMTTRMAIEAKEEGTIAIPAKMLLDILKTLPEHPLTFTVSEKTNSVEISSDFGKYKITCLNGDDFPRNAPMEGQQQIQLKSGDLADAINNTVFAAGNDDMRPVMSGVFFEVTEAYLRCVGTDAHKLVRFTLNGVKSNFNTSFIAPKKPLNLIKGILGSVDTDVTIEFTENTAHFSFDHVSLTCRLIDGKYPNYEAVIPKENPNKLTVDRLDFVSSIRRVSIFSNKTTHQVRLRMGGSELNISAEDLDFANEAQERLTCTYSGEDMEIGFNSRFLQEMLNNLNCDNVNLALSAPNRAGILTPVENEKPDNDIMMIVMPVMLNS